MNPSEKRNRMLEKVRALLTMLKNDQRTSLYKKLVKNKQRAADKAGYQLEDFIRKYQSGSLKSKGWTPISGSLKSKGWTPISGAYISEMWPVGQYIEFTDKKTEDTFRYTRVNATDLVLSDEIGQVLERTTLSNYTKRLSYYQMRSVLKRLIKNNQRKIERMKKEQKMMKS